MNMNQHGQSSQGWRAALWAMALVAVAAGISAPETVRRIAFSAPAAHLAALMTGAPCIAQADGYRLPGPDIDLVVVPACAAVDFFCLLTGFLSVLMCWRRGSPASQLAILPLAWFITVITNAVRLASCWQADTWARAALPPSLWPSLHLATGVATFLLSLTAIFFGMTLLKTTHGSEEQRSAS